MPMPIIRTSRDEDIEAIAAIYAVQVREGTGTFETDPPSVIERPNPKPDRLLGAGDATPPQSERA